MIIAQISDLHVAEEGSAMRRFVDANAKLAAAVSYLNGLQQRPDLVVATGDLTDHGRPEQYGLLREILEDLQIPLRLVIGNHDERGPLLDAMRATHPYLPAEGPLHYVDDDWPVRIVALDTTKDDHHDGEIDASDLAWLDRTLGDAPDTPTVVVMHHPPFRTGIWWMDCIGLTGAEAVEQVVRRHPQVRNVLCGHLHRPITTVWGSTVVSTAPSTTHQTACDLHPDHGPTIAAEPPMLQLHWFTDDRFVSHTTVFERPESRIEIATVVSDWETAKARIRQGPPFAKGGAFG